MSPDQRHSARIPAAVPGFDLRSLPLSPLEAYVFSRIDGISDEADIVLGTGLDATTVGIALDRLAGFGAIRFAGHPIPRTASRELVRAPHGSIPAPRISDIVPKGAAAAPSSPPARPTPVPPSGQRESLRAVPVTQLERYVEAARMALGENNPTGAANFYRLALALAPRDRTLRAALEACTTAAAEARAFSRNADQHVAAGDAAAREYRWPDAARHYEEAALLVPRNASVLYKAAGALHRSGDNALALEFARRSASLAPGGLETWILLARIHETLRSLQEAREALDRAARIDPGDPRLQKLRAKLRT